MNKPFENTFDVKFDEKAMEIFNDLIKEKGIRHFKLESDLYGILDVVLYKEYQKIEKELDKYKNVIDKIKEYIDEDEWTSVNGVITAKLIKNKIDDLLEEVE